MPMRSLDRLSSRAMAREMALIPLIGVEEKEGERGEAEENREKERD